MSLRAALSVLALAAATLPPGAALAQAAPDWSVTCAEARCTLSRAVSETASGRTMATVLLSVGTETEGARFGVALPLGVALVPGVRMLFAERSITASFEVCFPDGCRAVQEIDMDTLAALESAGTLELQFFSFADERILSIDVPLVGLAAAVENARTSLAAQR